MFGNIAPSYDLLNHLLSLNIDHYWRWRTTRLVPPRRRRARSSTCAPAPATWPWPTTARPAAGADRRRRFLSRMLCRGRDEDATPQACRRASASSRPTPSSCPSPTTLSDHHGGVRPAQRHRHRSRPRRDGARDPARRPGGDPGILAAAATGCSAGCTLLLSAGCCRSSARLISRSKDNAYRYLPASVLEFPDGEPWPSGCGRMACATCAGIR